MNKYKLVCTNYLNLGDITITQQGAIVELTEKQEREAYYYIDSGILQLVKDKTVNLEEIANAKLNLEKKKLSGIKNKLSGSIHTKGNTIDSESEVVETGIDVDATLIEEVEDEAKKSKKKQK